MITPSTEKSIEYYEGSQQTLYCNDMHSGTRALCMHAYGRCCSTCIIGSLQAKLLATTIDSHVRPYLEMFCMSHA